MKKEFFLSGKQTFDQILGQKYNFTPKQKIPRSASPKSDKV